jgi:hypothetical protein
MSAMTPDVHTPKPWPCLVLLGNQRQQLLWGMSTSNKWGAFATDATGKALPKEVYMLYSSHGRLAPGA